MDNALLGIVQGLTEFLPISSSGHLVIFQNLFGEKSEGTLLEVLLHLGTFMATIVVFRQKIKELLVGLIRRKKEETQETGLILLACLPTGLIGILAADWLSSLFESPIAVFYAMIFTALLLWSTRYIPPNRKTSPLNWKKAFAIGVIQGIAIIPGISRSGSTICGALHMGVDRKRSGEFSFLISLPAIAGAVLLDLIKLAKHGTQGLVIDGSVIFAIFLSFAVGLFALLWLLKFVQQGRMHLFAPYVLLVGMWGLWYF